MIQECLPPTVSFVLTVASTAPSTFAFLKDFSTSRTKPNTQYAFLLSPSPIHDHLNHELLALWEDPHWSESEEGSDEDEDRSENRNNDQDAGENYQYMLRPYLKGIPPRLKEGPEVKHPKCKHSHTPREQVS
jgi:hypothetical protein